MRVAIIDSDCIISLERWVLSLELQQLSLNSIKFIEYNSSVPNRTSAQQLVVMFMVIHHINIRSVTIEGFLIVRRHWCTRPIENLPSRSLATPPARIMTKQSTKESENRWCMILDALTWVLRCLSESQRLSNMYYKSQLKGNIANASGPIILYKLISK
jgi:hypothetical protein